MNAQPHNRSCRVLQRSIPSGLQAVESLGLEIRSFMRRQGVGPAAFPVELAARECLNNAVLHGNRGSARRRVLFELRVGRIWIRLRVTDAGKGFDWRRAQDGHVEDQASPHGRGLAICSRYAHRIAFNRCGNQITLWLHKTGKDR
jgi:serine/threonine-protein kinase RsbW